MGTAWTGRASVARVDVDPALNAGEVALIQVAAGTAWTLAADLTRAGATEVATFDSVNVVSARLSDQALAAISTNRTVLRATTDATVTAAGGKRERDLDEDPNGERLDSIGVAAIGAPEAWKRSTGKDVVVALMDSGIGMHPDLGAGKVVKRMDFVDDHAVALDPAGHGTHLAGVIAGKGTSFRGVAPDAKLVDLRVLDRSGEGTLSDVIAAFDWLLKNRKAYHIGILNLSFGTAQRSSYHSDLLAALAEAVWFSGVTVITAAGNGGGSDEGIVTPGIDPFVITAGSFDDQGTLSTQDDRESSFSAVGPTKDGVAKPDVLAPGRRVVSLQALDSASGKLKLPHKTKGRDDVLYGRMSGTSVASAMVTGVAALVLSEHRSYTPTKIKGSLVGSGRDLAGTPRNAVDAAKSLSASARGTNVGLVPSHLLVEILVKSGVLGTGITWEGVTWESVTWSGVTWEAVTWESVSWESVTWESVSWEGVMWETVTSRENLLVGSVR
jgi:subtilisin family serine protease